MLILIVSLYRSLMLRGSWPYGDSIPAKRLFATVVEAVKLYQTDPEAWNMLGEVRHHFGGGLSRTDGWRATLEAFERSIALDSLFAPSYYHSVDLSFALGDTARVRRYAAATLAINPSSNMSRGSKVLSSCSRTPASRPGNEY